MTNELKGTEYRNINGFRHYFLYCGALHLKNISLCSIAINITGAMHLVLLKILLFWLFLSISFNCIATREENEKCNDKADKREKLIGRIIRDEIKYNFNQNENRYRSLQYAYGYLKNDRKNLSLGTTDDKIYKEFYMKISNTNIGYFDSIRTLFNSGEIIKAIRFNSTIIDTNLIESNQKTINDILLNTVAMHINPDSVQNEILRVIAYQKPNIAGNSVYTARAMLGLIIDDRTEDESSSNKSLDINSFEKNESSYKVYPNPAKEQIIVEINSVLNSNDYIEIYDIYGKLIERVSLKSNNKTFISVSNLNTGIYLYRIKNNDQIVKSDKLVIIR